MATISTGVGREVVTYARAAHFTSIGCYAPRTCSPHCAIGAFFSQGNAARESAGPICHVADLNSGAEVAMDYQKVMCWGDSQTSGARTYGCYPLYLAQILNAKTRYRWHLINSSSNGYTARDLWFRIAHDLTTLRDVYQACVLIGTNDVGNSSPVDLFEEYYRQILGALQLNGIRIAYCGEIPPIWPDGHAFFPAVTRQNRDQYNARVRKVVGESVIGRLVEFRDLSVDCYTDPVHFNEHGSRVVADAFANAIMSQ